MKTVGTIELFFVMDKEDGRLLYQSENGTYQLIIPVNEQTQALSERIEMTLLTEVQPEIPNASSCGWAERPMNPNG